MLRHCFFGTCAQVTSPLLSRSILKGEKATWPQLAILKARLSIEKKLEAIASELQVCRDAAVARREQDEESASSGGTSGKKIDKRRRSTLF